MPTAKLKRPQPDPLPHLTGAAARIVAEADKKAGDWYNRADQLLSRCVDAARAFRDSPNAKGAIDILETYKDFRDFLNTSESLSERWQWCHEIYDENGSAHYNYPGVVKIRACEGMHSYARDLERAGVILPAGDENRHKNPQWWEDVAALGA